MNMSVYNIINRTHVLIQVRGGRMEDYDDRRMDDKCKKLKNDIQLLINDLPHDKEYLERLKKFIKFKTLQNESNTY
jgi:hypothetical protein